jgi:hypothetical protein
MPFPVKYNSGNVTGSIIKGNVALAVNDIVGPTSVTGWYNGPNFTQGTYQIVETSASGDPDVFCPRNEAELIQFVKSKGALSGVTGSSTEALKWIATQNNLLAVNEVYPNIVTDGDVLNLDAGFAGSYPVNPFQVNLLYNNGVYTPSFSPLTIAITASTITPNYKFRITTPSNYINPYTRGDFRLNFPLSILTNYQSYNLSFNYQIISGSVFNMTDWNDTVLTNVVNTNYGNYRYSSATGTTTPAGGVYNSTYRFMDFAIETSSIVDIWDIQLTQNVSASLLNTGSGTTWYDISGNNNSGSLINGTSYNTNNYMVFDGIDDYIPLSSSVTLTGSFTWTVLCESNAMSGAQNRQVYLGSSAAWFEQSDNDTFFIVYSGGNLNLELPNGLIPQNQWYNITITHKPDNTFDFYYNGIKQVLRGGGTTPVSASFNINTIGAIGGGGRYWNGSIANALLYNRLLSDSEILQNYYQAPIVTNGLTLAVDAGNLVSYERGSTTTYSLTGSATGSLLNGTGYTSSFNGSWVFDGTDDRLTFGSPNMTSSCTVNQWIQPLSGSATTMRTVEYVTVNSATAVIYSQLIKLTNIWYHQTIISGYQAGYAFEMNMYFQSNVTQFVQNNTPYNFSFTWERTPGVNSTLKTYLNGVFREQQIQTNDYWANTASLSTATYNIANTYKGNIGTTSFYNRALTAAEVTQNYNAQKARFGL